jgi:hypothetical protein
MNIKQAYEESYEYYFPRSARLKVEEELARKNESVRLYYSFDDLLDLISSYFVKSRYDFDDDISEYVEFPVEVLAECVYGYASHLLGDLDMFKTPDIP